MSYSEINSGRLQFFVTDTPYNRERLFDVLVSGSSPYDEDDFLDLVYANDFLLINGNIYKGFFDVRGAGVDEGLEDVEVSKDGDIYFTTIHYNGGASLEEVIEGALKRKQP
jgi:hypothetical protein